MKFKKLLYAGLSVGMNALSYPAPTLAGRLTFRVFATPPPPRIRSREAEFLATAERYDLDVDGERNVIYRWGPNGAPLVFCTYGWGYNAGRWRHYVPALLKAGYRVVAYDPVGHGRAQRGTLEFPKRVRIQRAVLEREGRADLVLAHSFGGGCIVEALRSLPPPLRPRRICLMAIFSEVRWIFLAFTVTMGLRRRIYQEMENYLIKTYGRSLDEFDVAHACHELTDIETLIIHDPEDKVTTFRNARRNHSHWTGSYLYAPEGAGHHLGTAGMTRAVLDYLIKGTIPAGSSRNTGDLEPLPAVITPEDMAVSGGVSDYYK